MKFSLFFFSADEERPGADKYRFVLDAARFADSYGFEGVWVPERHFDRFGGLYPNPSLLGAALAMATERVRIRAGSVVIPLHNSLRVAEEWAVVDNLSGGRVDVSFATGWLARDFVLAGGSYENRREDAYRMIAEVQTLWAGGEIEALDGNDERQRLRSFPRPLQPRLPTWISSGLSIGTFVQAGSMGANVLTAMLSLGLETLRERVDAYRQARLDAGHDPAEGRVTVMLHTYLGEALGQVLDEVREPMHTYLHSHAGLLKAFATPSDQPDGESISEEDEDALVEFAFRRLCRERSLIGTSQGTAPLLRSLAEIGVDEVACLVDFGLPDAVALDALPRIAELRETWRDSDEK